MDYYYYSLPITDQVEWIDPVLFSIGNLHIRWYGLMYIISFLIGYVFVKRNIRAKKIPITDDQYDTLLFRVLLGVIVGGRLGYVLFYDLSNYLSNPLKVFAVWEGGMSFHGGWIAVVIFGFFYMRKHRLNFFGLADAFVPFASLGLMFGRIGNFINGELYGRVTDVPWAMVFPNSDGQLRHPSQLYQSLTEGFLLFVVLQIMQRKVKTNGITFWSYVGLYGLIRFFIEFFREPDYHIGFVFLNLSMGQILCIGMMAVSIIGFGTLKKSLKKDGHDK